MPTTHVAELEREEEWDEAIPILRQLWTDADPSWIRSWREEDGYHLFGLYAGDGDEMLVAVAGVSIQRVLHHVRHAWIHDFVVDEAHRSEGYGSEILAFVEGWARERDCEYVALALRSGNDGAQQFYEASEMERWGDVIEKEL